jgi:leucyl aminopeptidase (aminopeptidase T)
MIEQLMDGLDNVDGEVVDTSIFHAPQHKDIFLKAVALVALADGKVLKSEAELLEKYSLELGLDTGHGAEIMTEVGIALLSYFRGVVATRPKMEEIGRQLGLSNESIARALDPEP